MEFKLVVCLTVLCAVASSSLARRSRFGGGFGFNRGFNQAQPPQFQSSNFNNLFNLLTQLLNQQAQNPATNPDGTPLVNVPTANPVNAPLVTAAPGTTLTLVEQLFNSFADIVSSNPNLSDAQIQAIRDALQQVITGTTV